MAPARNTRNHAAATPLTLIDSNPQPTHSTPYLKPVVKPESLFNSTIFRHFNIVFNDGMSRIFELPNKAILLDELRNYLLEAIDVIDKQAMDNNIPIDQQCIKSCTNRAPDSIKPKSVVDVEVMPRLVLLTSPLSPSRAASLQNIRHDLRHAPPLTQTSSSKGSPSTKPPGKAVHKLVRVVIDFRGSPPTGYFNTPLVARFRHLNEFPHSPRRFPRPLGLHRNRRGNLIVSFPGDTSLDKIRPYLEDIKRCLGVPETFKAYLDVPWAKVHLANIPARDSPDSPVYSEKALNSTLQLNPAVKDLHLVTTPKWIRPLDKITGVRTSAVLVFEDPDGSIARQIIKAPIFAFGSPITVKPWLATPPIKAPAQPFLGTAMDTE